MSDPHWVDPNPNLPAARTQALKDEIKSLMAVHRANAKSILELEAEVKRLDKLCAELAAHQCPYAIAWDNGDASCTRIHILTAALTAMVDRYGCNENAELANLVGRALGHV